jgi:hypothetical protein
MRIGFRVRHRASTRLLGRFLRLNWSNGRPSSLTARLGKLSWNSRKPRRARVNLPGGLHSEVSFEREDRRHV